MDFAKNKTVQFTGNQKMAGTGSKVFQFVGQAVMVGIKLSKITVPKQWLHFRTFFSPGLDFWLFCSPLHSLRHISSTFPDKAVILWLSGEPAERLTHSQGLEIISHLVNEHTATSAVNLKGGRKGV